MPVLFDLYECIFIRFLLNSRSC